jgi:hypothetical protein
MRRFHKIVLVSTSILMVGLLVRATRRRQGFRTTAVNLGQCYLSNLDNVTEVLAFAEGEFFR